MRTSLRPVWTVSAVSLAGRVAEVIPHEVVGVERVPHARPAAPGASLGVGRQRRHIAIMALLSQTLKADKANKKMKRGPTTPKEPLSKEVQRVLNRLPSKAAPVRLSFTDLGQDYKEAACHVNAKHRAETAGGLRVHGWVVWQYPRAAQAEFHSVWRNADGDLVNITPHRNDQAEILFVEDPSLKIGRDPTTGLAIVFSDITSEPGPKLYKAGKTWTSSPVYTVQIQAGDTLEAELNRLKLLDFV